MLNYFGELFGSVVWWFGAGHQKFDGRIEFFRDIVVLNAVREGVTSNPTAKCLVRNVAVLRDDFLLFPLRLYQLVNSFPKCNGLIFHRQNYRIKMRKSATILLDNVLYMRIIKYRKFQK